MCRLVEEVGVDVAKVCSKFQIVIPKGFRESLDLEPGQELHIYAIDRTNRASSNTFITSDVITSDVHLARAPDVTLL